VEDTPVDPIGRSLTSARYDWRGSENWAGADAAATGPRRPVGAAGPLGTTQSIPGVPDLLIDWRMAGHRAGSGLEGVGGGPGKNRVAGGPGGAKKSAGGQGKTAWRAGWRTGDDEMIAT